MNNSHDEFLLNCTTEEFLDWLNKYNIGDQDITLTNPNYKVIFVELPVDVELPVSDFDNTRTPRAVRMFPINNHESLLDNINKLLCE